MKPRASLPTHMAASGQPSSRASRPLRCAATLVLLLSGALTGAAADIDRGQLERRLQSVATLIESSSAARQIESSGESLAREKRDNARLIHREAQATLAAGDAEAASRLLDQAAREMMNGVRLARPEQVVQAKARQDYDTRLDSARALLAAQQRITAERAADGRLPPEAQAATASIAQLIDQAEAASRAGQLASARQRLDRAYLMARVSIEALRRGDTLVRSLHFASAREEHDYEVDRYETHRMLVQMLQSERPAVVSQMQPAVEQATRLRAEAAAQAGRGDHAQAVRSLEAATRELVRAIRSGGLFVPG